MRSAAGLIAAVVVAASGCGGGDDHDAAPPPPPATPERHAASSPAAPRVVGWRGTADAICTDFESRVRALHSPANPARYEQQLAETLPLARRDLDQLGQLRVPDKDAAAVADLTAALEVRLVALDRLAEATGNRDEARARKAMDREEDARVRARAVARRLGLHECGRR